MARTLEERADYIRTFASQVSHEFKAPLTAIQGAVELLHDHADTMSSAERGVFLENLAADAKRLERLVRRLLELARADMAALGDERADLAAVLEATVARQRALGLEVALELDPGLTSAPMSAEALESVLTNLLDNARQHGGPGGSRHDPGSDGRIPGRRARVDPDRGRRTGRVQRQCPTRLRAVLHDGARSRRHTGLGLAIVRSLLNAHGGSIALVPSARGATFRVEIPMDVTTGPATRG